MINKLRLVLLQATAIAVCLAPLVMAHEGHDHRVMGTVAKIQENQLEVKAQDVLGRVEDSPLRQRPRCAACLLV